MLVKEIKRLHDCGAISDEMYKELEHGFTDSGEFIGIVPNLASSIYGLKFNPYTENFNIRDVFEKVCSPWLGADTDMPELFGKYGYTYCGIGDGFDWFHENKITDIAISNGHIPIEQATELELWKMIALSNTYWRNMYQEWDRKSDKKVNELLTVIDELTERINKLVSSNYR